MIRNINPSGTVSWHKLRNHFQEMEYVRMQDLFAEDSERASRFHVKWNELLFDYSKNKISEETLRLLVDLAEEVGLKKAISDMFEGVRINVTENRAVLHTALRDFSDKPIMVDSFDVKNEIVAARKQIKSFTEEFISGNYKTSNGQKFTDVINVGIGGSDLGPKMVVNALENYRNDIGVHYISNVDDDYLYATLDKLDPKTTLVLIVSKTFTTQETIENAKRIKGWLEVGLDGVGVDRHMVGVTASYEEAVKFGVSTDNVFPMWDYVGGRFSLWSAVGLSISLAVGYKNFEELLLGANELDEHFKNSSFEENIPVLMALLSIWYNNFYGYETEAVVPYSQLLERFPAHLQQMIMESNGKNKTRDGYPVNYQTGTLIWGEVGVSAQHAFFQLFHQGTKVIPIDFIGFVNPFIGRENSNHDILMSNFFGQSEALLNGKVGEGYSEDSNNENLSSFKEFYGNKPSNTLLIESLTPRSLGALIALYEHKTYVQGIIWNIFSFDQFGVEYGKFLAKNIQSEIKQGIINKHDSSTSFLLNYYLSEKNHKEL
ncbi:glucose-6-phosphate isomerase [Myroides guanonis]|uniref:Glucose-6-phosphate isomerase n=1 Tax=Myroides guanonis TaxID=1150112 RepID=A0A1I3MUT9_9FLAO|nr:glucose-6-phosphate isomerase [Myroides guanonis]SFJ00874.1 glucose-6-phosphate isomerase [Myroides guanonis]